MEEKDKKKPAEAPDSNAQAPKTDDWASDALAEMDDFIESQGIYIRQ